MAATRRRRSPSRPVHYEADLEAGARPISLDARSLTLPSIAIVAVVGAFMWGTWVIGAERNRLDGRITAVITTVERLAESVDRLASGVASSATDRYTRSDHDAWCALSEARNKGWVCPPLPYKVPVVPIVPEKPRSEARSIINGLKDAK